MEINFRTSADSEQIYNVENITSEFSKEKNKCGLQQKFIEFSFNETCLRQQILIKNIYSNNNSIFRLNVLCESLKWAANANNTYTPTPTWTSQK